MHPERKLLSTVSTAMAVCFILIKICSIGYIDVKYGHACTHLPDIYMPCRKNLSVDVDIYLLPSRAECCSACICNMSLTRKTYYPDHWQSLLETSILKPWQSLLLCTSCVYEHLLGQSSQRDTASTASQVNLTFSQCIPSTLSITVGRSQIPSPVLLTPLKLWFH